MASIGTYWRTIRHLKTRQIWARLVFGYGAAAPQFQAAPEVRRVSGGWVLAARRRQSLFPDLRFRFLNEEHDLEEVGWDSPAIAKLWRYNLHYFDDLNSFGSDERRGIQVEMLRAWLAANPPVKGSGWEPYPTSLRIVNWIKWFRHGMTPEQEWLDSLAHQTRWLARRLEWHLLGNHLFANAKALFISGLFFAGKEADGWRSEGARILMRELDEQILADGGQFERSPMYHRIAWEDVLDLLLFLRCYGAPDGIALQLQEALAECASRMWAWADLMRYPDGSMPLFNDSAEGVAPDYAELCRVALALGLQRPIGSPEAIALLSASGYARLRWRDAVAFFDVGEIGPDYLPGHAHADTLSLELEIAGRKIVVNRGTSCYGMSVRRSYERSTAAKSTVQAMGEDSSETWSSFRVGRRARPRQLVVANDSIACSHDGYQHLRGRPVHRRQLSMRDAGLDVVDTVTGSIPATARYHLAPGLSVKEKELGRWVILESECEVVELEVPVGILRLVSSEHASEFGWLSPADTVEIELVGGRAEVRFGW